MKYCLDANVFIEAHRRYYSFDIALPFWEALVNWGAQQILCGLLPVYDDLLKVMTTNYSIGLNLKAENCSLIQIMIPTNVLRKLATLSLASINLIWLKSF